jgi:cell division septation protein DedD
LAKARQRRVALDQDRAARDSRVESAAAEVYVLIEDRSAAELAVQAANVAIGAVLRRLFEQESLTLDGVARLCDLELAEVRRLTRTSTASTRPAEPVSSPVAPHASDAATVTELRSAGDADAEPSPPESPRARDGATRRAQ